MTESDHRFIPWRCFHCDAVFYEKRPARDHFGAGECSTPACQIKAGAESSLIHALREAERSAQEAWFKLHEEMSEVHKELYVTHSRHQQQLEVAEELGFEQGLKAGRGENAPL